MLPTPQYIIQGTLELLAHHNWRQSIYTTVDTKGKATYHMHDLPCTMCGTRLPLVGLTVQDALLQAFNAYNPPLMQSDTVKDLLHLVKRDGSVLTFGDMCSDKELLRKLLSDHDRVLFETKCLIARMDSSIRIREFDTKDGFLYPLYIDIPEWNDRKGQTKEHVTHTLELALAGNVPNEKGT
jgi:hypothetical protein